MTTTSVDLDDVQGIVRFGYGKMTQAEYILLRVRNASAARAWLRSAPITTAATMSPPPTTAMHVAFTAPGLEALGVPASVRAGFSPEFIAGMTEQNRVRRLGDVGGNAPATWEWGWSQSTPHLVVMFFADPVAEHGGLDAFVNRATGGEWSSAFDVLRRLSTSDLDGVEPFGFADGISQPEIDWPRLRTPAKTELGFSNVVALGEFLLGYPNEYRKYTDRPILDANAATDALPAAEDSPEKKDLGRNGTYLVMRQLRQDVRQFWQFVTQRANGGGVAEAERLAAAFVGRTRSGDPLVPVQHRPIPGIGGTAEEARLNQFTFDDDPSGAACPFGAHVRRVNPRNGDLHGHPRGLARLSATFGLGREGFRDDLTSPVRFHRVLRRGREYGPGLSPAEALEPAPPNEPERGLHFLCLNANISRQFEFLQNAWVMNTKFSGLTGASDPLLGNREPIAGCPATGDFVLEQHGAARKRVTGLPQFITVRGGAYFFLPGLRALRYLARD